MKPITYLTGEPRANINSLLKTEFRAEFNEQLDEGLYFKVRNMSDDLWTSMYDESVQLTKDQVEEDIKPWNLSQI